MTPATALTITRARFTARPRVGPQTAARKRSAEVRRRGSCSCPAAAVGGAINSILVLPEQADKYRPILSQRTAPRSWFSHAAWVCPACDGSRPVTVLGGSALGFGLRNGTGPRVGGGGGGGGAP